MIGIYAWRMPLNGLDRFLGEPVTCRPFFGKSLSRIAVWTVLGGQGGQGGQGNAVLRAAEKCAARRGVECWRLSPGFLGGPESLVVDGPDAAYGSRLERAIAVGCSEAEQRRACALIELWRRHLGSCGNGLSAPPQPERGVAEAGTGEGGGRVLVIADDLPEGPGGEAVLERMLAAAHEENPGSEVWLSTLRDRQNVRLGDRQHVGPSIVSMKSIPSSLSVPKSGLHGRPRPEILSVPPGEFLSLVHTVYTLQSPLGFHALLLGKKVRTFGRPFYSGWSLTQDDLPPASGRSPASLAALVHAALVSVSRYVHPQTGQPDTPENLIPWVGLQRAMRSRFPEKFAAVGFSPWKKPLVRDFLRGTDLQFVSRLSEAPADKGLVVWGTSRDAYLQGITLDRPVLRLEDGFLRSVGLGAGLVRPLSWVVDPLGIYYDATRPSLLEHLLQTFPFDPALLERAAKLRQQIVALGLTKYNVGSAGWTRPATTRRLLLVPGQVESDASIRFGSPRLKTNLDLLRAVREAEPDAFILYKPHPDVVAGLRARGQAEDQAARFCDAQVTDTGMAELLPQVDEIHTLTSLTGFEALLRGKPVTCYGQPFYAGWGLTHDREPCGRRTRQLTLNELVAATLLVYPTYTSCKTGFFMTAEDALAELLALRRENPRGTFLTRALSALISGGRGLINKI
jgi:capsular polysaccharide export protein